MAVLQSKSTADQPYTTGMEPRIRKTPGVIGGDACIGRRRIEVWMVVECRDLGMSDDIIRNQYETPLRFDELQAAWEYASNNTEEISAVIRRQAED
jgi:uncharacterized protein (DUF433 family)